MRDRLHTDASPRVLLAQDRLLERRWVRAALWSAGFHVIETSSGTEAVAALSGLLLRRTSRGPHGVVLDLTQPPITSLTLLRGIRLLDRKIPAMLVVDEDAGDTLQEASRWSPVSILPRPAFPPGLARAVRDWATTKLGGSTPGAELERHGF